ncbi:MAG: hypothetical protein IJA14_00805 [Alphaproteobacteria bacterium]|nr:hypothetical protein [Alphaproteobacteria bacterium]
MFKFKAFLMVGSCTLASLCSGMILEPVYNKINLQLHNINRSWEGIQSSNFELIDQNSFVEVGRLLNALQNEISRIANENMTPEDAGNIVRNFKLKDGSSVLDESSPNALIESFHRIYKVLLGQDRAISDIERIALLRVMECYANAVPGELTYPCSDERQAEIIDAAIAVYNKVQ